jgi:hypothetical protein
MLLKKSQESATIPSDQYLPSVTEPLGISHETLVQGLVCLKFITPRSDKCRINHDEWKAFKETYMLGHLFELELCTLIGGPERYYVKMGRECRLKAVKCINGVKGSGGEFVVAAKRERFRRYVTGFDSIRRGNGSVA